MTATTRTTATEPSAEAYFRVQARELLGIAPDATADEVFQLTMEFLDGSDGDVASAQFDAIELLHGIVTEQDLITGLKLSDFRAELEVTLGEEIEQFARQFFDIPPEARSSAWDSLYQRSEISIALRRRLERLQTGLLVEPPQLETIVDQRQDKLIRTQLVLFRQRPMARGPLLTAARQEMSQAPHEWSAAIGRFAKSYPDVAKLVPEFVELGDCLRREAQAAVKLEKERKSWARYKGRARFWAKYSLPAGCGVVLIYMLMPSFLLILSGWPEHSGMSQPSTPGSPWIGPSDPDPSLSPDEAKRLQEMLIRIRENLDREQRRKASQSQSPTDSPVAEGHDSEDPGPHPLPRDEPQVDPPLDESQPQ